MKSKKSLIIIDLDGTITQTDSLINYSIFMLIKKFNLKFFLIFPLIVLLKVKIIDNRKFKILYTRYILKNQNVSILENSVVEFLNCRKFLNSLNYDVINFYRKYENYYSIIMSANFSFLVKPISDLLLIDNYISIDLEVKNNKYSGKIINKIPYGIEKFNIYKSLFEKDKEIQTIGIADSESDLPLLKFLDEGYLINYSKRLKKTYFNKI